MMDRILPCGDLLFPLMCEQAFEIFQPDHAWRHDRERFIKFTQRGDVVGDFAAGVHFSSGAPRGQFTSKFGSPLKNMTWPLQSGRHQANHITQAALSLGRLSPGDCIRPTNEKHRATLQLFAPSPHPTIKISTRRSARWGRARVLQNRSPPPVLRFFN